MDSQLVEATRFKTEGNSFYKEKNVRAAIGRYHRALLVLRSLDSSVMSNIKGFGPKAIVLTAEQEEQVKNMQIDCYNNLAGKIEFRLTDRICDVTGLNFIRALRRHIQPLTKK